MTKIAIYHCSIKIGSRANKKSSLAASAYRSGEKLKDERLNCTFDYSRKQAIVFSDVILPTNAPKEWKKREVLWNAVEQSEVRSDAQVFREFEISLPNECSSAEKRKMTYEFCKSLADEGMCVDYSIHDVKAGQYKTKHKKATNDNCHVHILCTLRAVRKGGKFAPKRITKFKLDADGQKIPILDKSGNQKKRKDGRKCWEREDIETTDWNTKEKLQEWRKRWQDIANRYLAPDNQIDCRTIEEQIKSTEKELTEVIQQEYQVKERDLSERLSLIRVFAKNNGNIRTADTSRTACQDAERARRTTDIVSATDRLVTRKSEEASRRREDERRDRELKQATERAKRENQQLRKRPKTRKTVERESEEEFER